MELTDNQKIALEKMSNFLDSDIDLFLLKGYAGTGKTTILKEFIKIAKKKQYTVKPLASTGKATKVLSEKIGKSTLTLHSAAYNNPSEDETGKSHFEIKEKNNAKKQIYIIDEASMLGNENNENNTVQFGTGETLADLFKHKNTKIIFVGDPFQLLPVKNKKSYALDKKYLEDEHKKSCDEYILTDIMRQKNINSIVDESFRIRKCYNEKISFELTIDNKDIKEFTDEEAIEFFIKKQENTAIITHTNKDTLYYSNLIRKRLGKKDIVCDGDRLLVVYNNKAKNLNNGEVITVKKVIGKTIIQPIEKDDKVEELSFQQILADINGKEEKLYIVLDLLQDIKYNSENNKVLPLLKKLTKENVILGNALQVRYGYAMTCHKAQGSEFDNVILKLRNKNCTKEEEYRWLYTGITRAKQKLFILNNDKYIEYGYDDECDLIDFKDDFDLTYKEDNKEKKEESEKNKEKRSPKLEIHKTTTIVIHGKKQICTIIHKIY